MVKLYHSQAKAKMLGALDVGETQPPRGTTCQSVTIYLLTPDRVNVHEHIHAKREACPSCAVQRMEEPAL